MSGWRECVRLLPWHPIVVPQQTLRRARTLSLQLPVDGTAQADPPLAVPATREADDPLTRNDYLPFLRGEPAHFRLPAALRGLKTTPSFPVPPAPGGVQCALRVSTAILALVPPDQPATGGGKALADHRGSNGVVPRKTRGQPTLRHFPLAMGQGASREGREPWPV